MKIAVLIGSPKGEISITLQYIKFIQKKFPQHEFKLIQVAHDIAKLEGNSNLFKSVIDDIRASDAVIWAFPVYVFLVPAQYKRFIELISENGVRDAFAGKYTTVLSTSLHFFDNAAHNYMHGICDDLDMKYFEPFSADTSDLMIENMRRILLKWADGFFNYINGKTPALKLCSPAVRGNFSYTPGQATGHIDPAGRKIRVVADITDEKSNLAKMVRHFQGLFNQEITVVKTGDVKMRGGCLGCLHCTFDNICVYQDKDGFVDFFNAGREVDVMIYAVEIIDRFFSARMKMFWDRTFFNSHIPTLVDKQMAFIVSGPLSQLANMQDVLSAMAQMSGGNLAGIVTDECADSAQLDRLIEAFAARCVDNAEHAYVRPKDFLGVGGHKIFRDMIWSRLSFPFTADYKYYEEHGLFDFPQNEKHYLEFNNKMIEAIKDPAVKEQVRKMMNTEMLKSFTRIVETR